MKPWSIHTGRQARFPVEDTRCRVAAAGADGCDGRDRNTHTRPRPRPSDCATRRSRCLRRLSLHEQRRVLSLRVGTRDPSAGLKSRQARQALFKTKLSQTTLTRISIFIDLVRQIPSFRRSLSMVFCQTPNEEGDERNGKRYFSQSTFSWPGGKVDRLKSWGCWVRQKRIMLEKRVT